MLTTIYVRSFDGINYRTSPDGVRWADEPRCYGEYLIASEIKYFGLIGQGFWSLTGEVCSSYQARKAYHAAYYIRRKLLSFELVDLVGTTKPTKSGERRAIERAAIIRYLEIWQDTVRGKISRNNTKLDKVYWLSDAWDRYALRKQELEGEQGSVQRRLRIVRTKGLCH